MAMNDLSKMAATALLLVLAIVPTAAAVTYTVGDVAEWSSGTDYTTWVAGKTFRVGDTLEFKYSVIHSVDVVDKAGYDSCDSSSAIVKYFVSDNEIELKTVGRMYFICPTPGHCQSGMKLAITVEAAASSSPTPASPSPSSLPGAPAPTPGEDSPPSDEEDEAGSTPPPPPSLPPPPAPSSGASSELMSYVVLGISLVLASNAWIMD